MEDDEEFFDVNGGEELEFGGREEEAAYANTAHPPTALSTHEETDSACVQSSFLEEALWNHRLPSEDEWEEWDHREPLTGGRMIPSAAVHPPSRADGGEEWHHREPLTGGRMIPSAAVHPPSRADGGEEWAVDERGVGLFCSDGWPTSTGAEEEWQTVPTTQKSKKSQSGPEITGATAKLKHTSGRFHHKGSTVQRDYWVFRRLEPLQSRYVTSSCEGDACEVCFRKPTIYLANDQIGDD